VRDYRLRLLKDIFAAISSRGTEYSLSERSSGFLFSPAYIYFPGAVSSSLGVNRGLGPIGPFSMPEKSIGFGTGEMGVQ